MKPRTPAYVAVVGRCTAQQFTGNLAVVGRCTAQRFTGALACGSEFPREVPFPRMKQPPSATPENPPLANADASDFDASSHWSLWRRVNLIYLVFVFLPLLLDRRCATRQCLARLAGGDRGVPAALLAQLRWQPRRRCCHRHRHGADRLRTDADQLRRQHLRDLRAGLRPAMACRCPLPRCSTLPGVPRLRRGAQDCPGCR